MWGVDEVMSMWKNSKILHIVEKCMPEKLEMEENAPNTIRILNMSAFWPGVYCSKWALKCFTLGNVK